MLRKPRPTSLNVKDGEAHRLAKAISDVTGETITHVVTEALRERYQRICSRRDRASVDELLGIARRASDLVKGAVPDHADFLYDERGLPK